MRFIIFIIAVFIPVVALPESPVHPVSVDDIRVIKISAQDEKAVIKATERKLQIIKVGDKIGTNAKVTEITKGRVVIEELTDRGMETVIIRVENGKQRVERIRKIGGAAPNLYVPR